jgi:hypothetical protein
MTKEEYIQDVHSQNFTKVLYSMYQERFDTKRHSPFLNPQEFIMYIQMSGMINEYLRAAFNYYEAKFKINKLFDKDGKLIRFV